MRYIFILFFIFLLFSCKNGEENDKLYEMQVYKAEFMELKIPQNYHIESEIHWEIGYIYHVKNSDNKEIMYILGGGRTNNAVAYDVDTLSRDFSINNKIDTTVELDGKKMRIKIVVLQSARYINNVLAPLSVEFQYSPDSGDSLICEKIISSAKTI